MISFTENARQRLDQYMRQIRACLMGCEGIDADDVERDVRDHIERDLQSEAAPVSEESLLNILRRLGAPWQWIPQAELPWWRRCLIALRVGPEDYRLAYLSLGLFLFGMIVPQIFPIALVGGFLVARGVLSFDPTPAEMKQKRWLIYPSLMLAYFLFLCLFLTWPGALIGTVSDGFQQTHVLRATRFDPQTVYWALVWLVGTSVTGIWWIVAGGLMLIFPRIRRSFFRPFLLTQRLPLTIIAIGLSAALLCGIGAVVLYHVAAVRP